MTEISHLLVGLGLCFSYKVMMAFKTKHPFNYIEAHHGEKT